MKKQNGMSYIMLLLCIVLIIVGIGVIMHFIQKEYEEEKIETIKTEMLMLQGKIRILSEEVTMKKEGSSYIGKKVIDNLEDETVKKLIDGNVITQDENYYILEREDFEQLGLTDYKIEKIIVNYKTCEIIHPDGFKMDEGTYYKLSDFKMLNEENANLEAQENNE